MKILYEPADNSAGIKRRDFQAVKSSGFLYSFKLTDIEVLLVEIVLTLETESDELLLELYWQIEVQQSKRFRWNAG